MGSIAVVSKGIAVCSSLYQWFAGPLCFCWRVSSLDPSLFQRFASLVFVFEDMTACLFITVSVVRWPSVFLFEGVIAWSITVSVVGWASVYVQSVQGMWGQSSSKKVSDVRTIWPLSLSTFHMARVFSAYLIIRHGSVFVSTVFLLPLFVVPSFLVIKYPFVPGARRLETSGLYPCQAS